MLTSRGPSPLERRSDLSYLCLTPTHMHNLQPICRCQTDAVVLLELGTDTEIEEVVSGAHGELSAIGQTVSKWAFPTLTFQLAREYPISQSILAPLLQSNADVAHKSLFSQTGKLIIKPLRSVGFSTVNALDGDLLRAGVVHHAPPHFTPCSRTLFRLARRLQSLVFHHLPFSPR